MEAQLDRALRPFYAPGNLLVRERYAHLDLPWTLAQPVAEFDQSSFFRKDWVLGEEFFLGQKEVDLDKWEKMMGTASPVTRWREAHPEDCGTERDVLRVSRREIERLLHEAAEGLPTRAAP